MRAYIATALVLVALLAACRVADHEFVDDDVGTIDAANPGDASDDGGNAAPTVLSTTPVDLATDAEPGGVLTATFSEAMNPATINETTFVVSRSATSIAGQVTYDPVGRMATFQPEDRLSLLAGYTATITTAATDVDSVPLASNFSWSFSVRDGTWDGAEFIETSSGAAQVPLVSSNSGGTAFAVWRQFDGTRYNVWANRLVPGTGWEIAQLIETNNVSHAFTPSVAVDASGNAVAVWPQSDGTRENIWANRFVPGAGWGNAQLIESDNAGSASGVVVAIDPGGNAIAVWRQSDGTRDRLWANRFTPGTGWGTAQLIENESTGSASFASLAVDPDGNAVVVWDQTVGALQNVLNNRFVSGTGWGTAQIIASDANGSKVAMADDGTAIATWRQNDGTRYSIRASRFVPGNGWSATVPIETENTGLAFTGGVAVDGAGNALAVWQHYDGARNNVWANRFVVSTGWGTAELIEIDTGDASQPRVVADQAGNAVALWLQSDGTLVSLWANRFVVGSGWSTAQLIEANDTDSAGSAGVAIDGSGNAVATWTQSDGTATSVASNAFR